MSRDRFMANKTGKSLCPSTPSETPQEKFDRKMNKVLEDTRKAGVTTFLEKDHEKEVSRLNGKIKAKDEEIKARDEEIKARDEEIKARDQEIKARDQEIKARDQEIKARDQEINKLQGFNDRRTVDVVEKTRNLRKTQNMEHRDLFSPTNEEYANRIAEIAEKIPHKESIDELGNWTVSIELGGDSYKICNSIEKIDGYKAADYYEFEPWRKSGKYAQYINQKLDEGFHISAGEEFKDLLKKIGLQTGVDEQQDQYRVLSYLAGGLGALYLVEENGKDYHDCSSYSPESGKIRGFGVDYRESGFGQHLLIKKGEVEKKGGKNSLSKFVEYPGFSEKTGQEQVKIFADIMKSEKLIDVSEKGDFYEISINIPGQGITNMLITKDAFITEDRINDKRNTECHEKAEALGFDQMDKSDVFRLSKRLLKLFDKLGDNNVKTRIEDADGWEGSSSKGNSIWAFFVRFIHDVMHNSVDGADSFYHNFSYLWLKDIGCVEKYNSVSNFALMRYSQSSQDQDGVPPGGWSGEDGHFLYIK